MFIITAKQLLKIVEKEKEEHTTVYNIKDNHTKIRDFIFILKGIKILLGQTLFIGFYARKIHSQKKI